MEKSSKIKGYGSGEHDRKKINTPRFALYTPFRLLTIPSINGYELLVKYHRPFFSIFNFDLLENGPFLETLSEAGLKNNSLKR